MFTGIVEEIGTARTARRAGNCMRLEIGATVVLAGLRVGDSVAIDGVCQTVIAISPSSFTVETLAESLAKTTLGGIRVADRVNLERALCLGARLGGHLLQGHVNGVARAVSIRSEGQNRWLTLALPDGLERWCVKEGSIAVDGVSLTISALRGAEVEVNLIPLTRANTTLGVLTAGGTVNVETDIIGRYVESLLAPIGGERGAQGARKTSALEELLQGCRED